MSSKRHWITRLAIAVALLTGLPLFTGVAQAVPSNDNFADALIISSSPFSHDTDTTGSTTELGEPQPSCAPVGATVWYRLDLTEAALVHAKTFGSKFDTVIAVYTGTSLSGLTEVGCNDDDESLGSLQSNLKVAIPTAGTVYLQVGGYGGASGLLKLNVTQGLVNDDFEFATLINIDPFVKAGNTSSTTVQSGEPRGCGTLKHTIWFKIEPDVEKSLRLIAEGTGFSPVFNVYTGTALTTLQFETCSTGDGRASVLVSPGFTYYIQIGSFFEDFGGPFVFTTESLLPPGNDNFASATVASPLPYADSVDTGGATREDNEPNYPGSGDCFNFPIVKTVWYSYTAPNSLPPQIISADTLESDFDTMIAVYEGTDLNNLTEVACNDQYGGNQSKVSFLAAAGRTYFIQVGGWIYDSGNLEFSLEEGSLEDLLPFGISEAPTGLREIGTDRWGEVSDRRALNQQLREGAF